MNGCQLLVIIIAIVREVLHVFYVTMGVVVVVVAAAAATEILIGAGGCVVAARACEVAPMTHRGARVFARPLRTDLALHADVLESIVLTRMPARMAAARV